jgi:HEPN domain-containing protein
MAMSSQDKFEYWLDIAQYDLQTAETMLNGERWLYVAFMCQQALEKLAKGLYLLYVDDNTPRTHSIEKIFEYFEDKLSVEIPTETKDLFDKLSTCYLNNRYPEFMNKLSTLVKESEAKVFYSQTKKVFAWLLTLKP